MPEFSLSNSSKANKIPSLFLLSHLLFKLFFFIFLSPYLLMLPCSFTPLFFTTLFLLALFPPNPDHGNADDNSPSSDSRLGFLLSFVESLVRKFSSKNDENGEGIWFFEEFPAYLDVFRAPVLFEVLEGYCSESGLSGKEEEGREESTAHHVGPLENKPNGNFDQSPFGKDDGDKMEAARPIAEENKFCEKECNGVLEENLSYSGNDGRESRNHVVAKKKERSVDFGENPVEKDKGKLEGNGIGEENLSESVCSREQDGSGHVDLIQDPNIVNLEEKPAGEEDDIDKVEKNTKLEDIFCQKRDKEVKPLDTDPNKAKEDQDKMTLGSGSKVMCSDSVIDAKDSTAEDEEEEYFWTPGRHWEYNNRRSNGSMRKEKELRRTLAFKFYEERNNVDDDGGGGGGRSSTSKSEVMDLLWETYEDIEHDKVKGSTKSKATEEEDEEEEEEVEEEEKEKAMKSKYCCLQALKFSSGKVNLGMRKPSLVKISKALKSFGILHHVSKHGRKMIN